MIRIPLVIPELMLRAASPNRDEIAAQIAIEPNIKLILPPALRCVFLCFTNRCGSAYLGDLLTSTGLFHQANETLNAGEVLSLCREHGFRAFAEYFAHIIRRDTKGNIYIVKAAPEQLRLLVESGILGQIVDQSQFLYMNRADKLAQAISRTIAEQNNRWAWDSPTELTDDKLVYSSERIAEHMHTVASLNYSFDLFFALNGIVPVDVRYERLVRNPQPELDEIARRLSLPRLHVDPAKLRYRRQANEINQTWRMRFLMESEPPDKASFAGVLTGQAAAAAAPPKQSATAAQAVQADIIGHVRTVGDVTGNCGEWIGKPKSGLWIEGFSIALRQGLAPEDLEYQGSQNNGLVPPWVPGGEFCGTRGLSMPLQGLRVRLRGAADQAYECLYAAVFLDGSIAGPMTAGQLCQSASKAPLEAFQIVIRPKAR